MIIPLFSSLPQPIGPDSNPTFASVTITDPPSANDNAATVEYVLNAITGNVAKASCATVTNSILTATYNNGVSGVGATLTNSGVQASLIINGYTCALNDRVLVVSQTSTFQNGIYVVSAPGSVASNWVLTRATDYDQTTEMTLGSTTFITGGNQANTRWVQNSPTPTSIGTSPILFNAENVGDVIGPSSSTNNTIALFNGVTGKIIKGSSITVITNNITNIGNISAVAGDIDQLAVLSTLFIGQNGSFGNILLYPPSPDQGYLSLIKNDNSGNFSTSITVDGFAQESTINFGDVSETTVNVIYDVGPQTLTGKSYTGITPGAVPTPGLIGEVIDGSVGSNVAVLISSAVVSEIVSITLNPGNYQISGVGCLSGNITGTFVEFFVGTSPGSSTIGQDSARNTVSTTAMPSTASDVRLAIPVFNVFPTTTTTYYLKVQALFSGGAASAYGTITALRAS